MRNLVVLRSTLAGLLAVTVTGLYAQTAAAPAAAPSAQAAPNPDVIHLDDFVVTSSKSAGYRATNAISATGIGTKIGDTPLAISVITSDLIADTGLFDVREALNMVPGVLTNPVNESRAVIRGQTGLIAYRNGMYRRQLMTTWNMERIEVIKGPAAIFFGAVRPGGIVNTVTAKPDFGRNFSDVKATVGNEGYLRGEFFTNQVLSDKLAIRVGAGASTGDGIRQFEYKDESYAGLSATWKPTSNQQLTVDLEEIDRTMFYLSSYPVRSLANSKVYGAAGAIAAQANVNQVTTTADTVNRNYLTTLGYSGTYLLADGTVNPNFYPLYNMFAPYDYKWSLSKDAKQLQRSHTLDLNYLLKISDNLVWQTALNYAYDNTSGLQPSDGDTRPYADGTLRFRIENFINVRDSYNANNKLTWRFDLGPSKHTLQFGQDFQRVIFTRPGYLNPVNNTYNNSPGNNSVSGVTNVYATRFTPGVSTPVSLNDLFVAGGQTFNIVRKNYDEAFGYFIVDQAKFFNERLFVLAGARYNAFRGHVTYDKPVSNSSQSKYSSTGLATYDIAKGKGGITPQAGLLFKVLPDVSFFSTYSESIEANTAVDYDGTASEPIKSQSYDLGFKTEMLDGRLTSTLAYYDTKRQNLAYADTAKQLATGHSPYFIFGNSEHTTGLELETNWSVSKNYSVIAGWAHQMTAETTKSNNTAFVGRRFGAVPENTYNLWKHYTFSNGPLKNFSVGAGLQHNDATNLSQDPNIQVTLPAFTVFNAMASYSFKVGSHDVKAQFNVKNVADKRYREGADGYFAPARSMYLSLATKF